MLRTYAAPGVHVHDPDGEPAAARPGARTRAPGRLPWAHPVVVVLVALPVLGSTAVADVGGPYRYALLIALVAPLVFVVRDLRSASPSPARDQRPWTVSVRCALVGAVAGLVAGIVAQIMTANHRSCVAQTFGDCGLVSVWVAVTVGPLVAVAVVAVVLALLKVRHSFFIALLAVPAFGYVALAAAYLAPVAAGHETVSFTVAGAIAGALAGTAHARRLTAIMRCTALLLVVAVPWTIPYVILPYLRDG